MASGSVRMLCRQVRVRSRWISLTALMALGSATILSSCSSNGAGSRSSGTAVPPSITAQPVDQTVTVDQAATFSVTASGTAPLSYQWRKNGTPVSGATSAIYTTPATIAGDSRAQFTVVVSNSAGSITSNPATLTVNIGSSQPITITGGGSDVVSVTVAPSGSFQIHTSNPSWSFGGQVGFSLTNLVCNPGLDGVGSYQEIDFDYLASVSRTSGIRLYDSKPIILFTTTYNAAGANSDPFPVLSTYPQNPYHLSYDETIDFSPHVFDWSGLNGPLLSYDAQANAFLLTAASNFLVTQTQVNDAGALVTGINTSNIASLPQGFTHQTLLVVSPGIGQTYLIWGQALTALQGKTLPANDADPILKYIGYSTDNETTYYYNYNTSLGYPGTLVAVKTDFANHGIPLGYVELDSWFYPKGCNPPTWNCGGGSALATFGIYTYNADPAIFPADLLGFEQEIQLPLWTHARWIDRTSPYRQQYTISGNAITDSRYWQDRANYLQQSGGKVFEQDWLQISGDGSVPIIYNLTDPDAFLGNMASAMKSHGLNIQYCLPRAGHYLQSTKYDNVTTIRVSDDGFTQNRWNAELYNSQLAGALGLWPFTDSLMSSSVMDVLLSNLSAGPLAPGDAIGAENAANLIPSIRGDGVLIKPDAPMVPLDSIYIGDAQGNTTGPMIAWTYSNHAPLTAAYVFAFARGGSGAVVLPIASVGINAPAYVYNFFSKTGTLVSAGGNFTDTVGSDGTYYVIAPVGPSGISLLGDTGKFISCGRQRIAQLQDVGTLTATVTFAANETSITLTGYAPSRPNASATTGTVGTVSYDSATHLFSLPVAPGANQTAVVQLQLH